MRTGHADVMEGMLEALALDEGARRHLLTAVVPRQKGLVLGRPSGGRVPRSWAIADSHGLPVAVCVKALRHMK